MSGIKSSLNGRATELKQDLLNVFIQQLSSILGSETTLAQISSKLTTLNNKDFSTQNTLLTLAKENSLLIAINKLALIESKDFAKDTTTQGLSKESTLLNLLSKLNSLDNKDFAKNITLELAAKELTLQSLAKESTLFDIKQALLAGGVNEAIDSSIASSTTSVLLLAANTSRKGVFIRNDGSQNLFIKFGTTATINQAIRLTPQSIFEFPFPIYKGIVHGIWNVSNGSAKIMEII